MNPGLWQGRAPNWQHRGEKWLLLTVPTAADTLDQFYRVDRKTGTVTDLGRLMTERLRVIAVSPDERFLGVKHGGLPYGLELIDLETGARTTPSSEAQSGCFAWAPGGSRWAVRAAHPGSGLPISITFRWAEGGSHIDVGDGVGEVRHLYPPAPLVLVGGPLWSPDGSKIAVAAGIVSQTAGQPEEQAVWAVKVATNEWSKLYDLQPGETLSGRAQTGTLWP